MRLLKNYLGFGRLDTVQHLLSLGANIEAQDDGGLVPLHNACSFGHADVARLLLKSGANPNAQDNWNFTPLHEAALKGKVDCCVVLLQNGADPALKNADGKTVFDVADPAAQVVLSGISF